jgi:hypothetical protein
MRIRSAPANWRKRFRGRSADRPQERVATVLATFTSLDEPQIVHVQVVHHPSGESSLTTLATTSVFAEIPTRAEAASAGCPRYHRILVSASGFLSRLPAGSAASGAVEMSSGPMRNRLSPVSFLQCSNGSACVIPEARHDCQ